MADSRTSITDYVKEAFKVRWNMLLFGAGVAFAFISGRPDIGLPIVAAAELAYLTTLATNKRFRWIVDARRRHAEMSAEEKDRQSRFQELYDGLNEANTERFDSLRARCEVLQDLASAAAASSALGVDHVAETQLEGVNRLLWVFLKLLHTKQRLERFFHSTDEGEIVKLQEETQRRMEMLEERDGAEDDPILEKKQSSLKDTLNTAAERLENLKRARQNYEYVNMELERIAAKLSGLAEMAVNRQDPSIITTEVDDVARSVEATEEAISELQVYTGLTSRDTAAPSILSSDAEAEAKRKARQRQKAGAG